MRVTVILILSLICCSLSASSQTLSNATLTGKYFFRHVQFTTDAANNITDARSALGAVTFNGAGGYNIAGQQVIGTGPAVAFSTGGTYSLNSAGVVTLSNHRKPR